MKLNVRPYNRSFPFPAVFWGIVWLLISFGQALAASATPTQDPDTIRYQPLSFEPPRVERLLFENGLRLYLFPDRELPLIQIKAVVRTGSMYDPSGQEGVAELTAATMRTGGTAGMTGDAVDEALESMAAVFQVSVNRESAIFSFSILKKDLERGFDIFSQTLRHPSFEEKKLILGKDLKIEELRRIIDDPQKLAFREFGRLMHAGSPRGRLVTRDSVRAIGRDDLIRCHKLFVHPRNIMISITGDIGSEETKTLINKHFADWTSPEDLPIPPPLPRPQDGNIFFLTKDLPQSIVLIGWSAPPKKESRFYPFEVLDFMVGSGGFRSRIFQQIRTDMGLAYSAGSFYNAKPYYGLFGAYAVTKSESTVTVASKIGDIIRSMHEKPIPPQELERAKRAILNSFIFSFTSAEQIAFQKLMIEYDALPDDFLETYRRNIARVSAEDVRNTAVRNLAPGKAIHLIVGRDDVYRDVVQHFGTVIRIDATF